MILFCCTKKEFIEYVNKGIISNIVYDAYKKVFNKKTKLSQIKAWNNSLPYLKEIMEELPNDMGITIEYLIPNTSKRIDVILSGYDIFHKPVIIILELKQWEYAIKVENEEGIVKTKIGKKDKMTMHPSYQVLTYLELLKNYNIWIEENEINITPLVYLHNYNLTIKDDLYDKKFLPYIKKAPLFGKNNMEELKYILENNICFGDQLQIIKKIDQSKIKPTKKLTDVMSKMLNAKKEFIMLDEQKIILEQIEHLAKLAYRQNKKIVIIIKGGPGTGKSVLAIHALGELLSIGLVGSYVSKNMAPRKVYKNKLTCDNEEVLIHELFKSSSHFYKSLENEYDFLLVDEAHRLQEKSGIHNNIGENQIKEIIKASKLSVFFIDELQTITLRDIGSIENIEYYAKEKNATLYQYELNSQFRCNGSNSYLDFIEHLLYNKRGKVSFQYDFKVIDTPKKLHELIKEKNTNNNARLVAGFCWPRNAKNADNQDYHDIHIKDLSLSWNLKHGEEFATRKNAINEIGCVYNVQGLEFDYIGVIIGPDLKYQNKKVITDYKTRANTEKSLYGLHVLMKENKEYYELYADLIIRNTYRVLLTRGIKGCYVYCVDENLQKHLKTIINNQICS